MQGPRIPAGPSWEKGSKEDELGLCLPGKMKFTAHLSTRKGEGGASWERDGAGERGSLAFCSHRRGESSFICWPDWTDEISIFFIKGLPASAAGLPFPITHSLSIMQKAKGEGRAEPVSPDSGCNDPVSLRTRLRGKGGPGAAGLPRCALPGRFLACSHLPGHMRAPTDASSVPSCSMSRCGISMPSVELSCLSCSHRRSRGTDEQNSVAAAPVQREG